MNNTASTGFDTAKEGVARESEADDFASHAIFWSVKVREANVAVWSSASVEVSICMQRPPTNNCTSVRVKGVVSDALFVYLLGRRRKKNATIIMSVMHFVRSHVEFDAMNARRGMQEYV